MIFISSSLFLVRSPSPIESTSEAFEDARSEPDDGLKRDILLMKEEYQRYKFSFIALSIIVRIGIV